MGPITTGKRKEKRRAAKKLSPKTTPGPDNFTGVFFQTFKQEVIPTLFHCSMKKYEKAFQFLA